MNTDQNFPSSIPQLAYFYSLKMEYKMQRIFEAWVDGKNLAGYVLAKDRYKADPHVYATLDLAKTAITKSYTRWNDVYARNYLKQN